MKKFTLLLALMAIMPAMFASAFSELTITINENAEFYVVMDGRQYDSHTGAVVISSVSHGNHSMEVFKHTLVLNGFVTDRIFRGSVDVMPNKRIYATIDRFGSFVILRSENMNPSFDYGYGYDNGPGNSHGNGHGNGHGNSYGNGHDNGNHYGNNSGYYSSYSYNTGGYMPMGMSPESFSMLMASMRREAFDETRVRMATSAITMSGVTSAQLAGLMRMLTFDSNRLNLAKIAYNFVVDKNNIFLINDAFTFNSNADEFYRYIGAW